MVGFYRLVSVLEGIDTQFVEERRVFMDVKKILSVVDHTALKQTVTWPEIQALCDEGMQFGVASVCIPPCYVQKAAQYVQGKLKICTVVGFPNGYTSTQAKCFETTQAVRQGASEIDMVINLGLLRAGDDEGVLSDIRSIRVASRGKILKVIVETCLLSWDEKIRVCDIVSRSGADFIKTSTGFSTAGAMFDDIKLFKAHIAPHLKIKAAGGIRTLEQAERFLQLGVSRIGSSAIVPQARKRLASAAQAQKEE